MTCPHCANFHNDTLPEVKTRLIDTGMVQFEMRPFPLDRVALRGHALARMLQANILQWCRCCLKTLAVGLVPPTR